MLTRPCLHNVSGVSDMIPPSDHFSDINSATKVENVISDLNTFTNANHIIASQKSAITHRCVSVIAPHQSSLALHYCHIYWSEGYSKYVFWK